MKIFTSLSAYGTFYWKVNNWEYVFFKSITYFCNLNLEAYDLTINGRRKRKQIWKIKAI